jgi:branched-chain amino acid transport system permease protein
LRLENVIVGAQRDNNPIGPGAVALRARAMSALHFVGLVDKADAIVRNLPYGHQRLVEIARALAGQPRLLLLDEPAAGLNQTEKMELVELLKRLRGAMPDHLPDRSRHGPVAKCRTASQC